MPTSARELVVVAHQDDDLLFLSPDVTSTLQDGGSVVVVYLTAGDAGRTDATYYLDREQGVMEAYASLASIASPRWTETRAHVHGHDVVRRDLSGAALTLYFLRLPDGNVDGQGFEASLGTPRGSLQRLWGGRVGELRSVDGSETYARVELLATLAELFAGIAPTRINSLDGSDAHGFDHSDHRHAALFTADAAPNGTPIRLYRGYNVRAEPPNLEDDEAQKKWNAFFTYAQHDRAICADGACDAKVLASYGDFATRQYLLTPAPRTTGPIATANDLCLEVRADGTPGAGACAARDAQSFTLAADGRLSAQGACLTATSSGLAMAPCAASAHEPQRWSLLSSGSLLHAMGGCLLAPDAAEGAVTVAACDRSARSEWALRFGPDRVASDDPDAFDVPLLMFGDLDGDGRVDVCARRADGVYCALDDSGRFGRARRVSDAFSDSAGWAPDARALSLRMGDVDGDGAADICGWRGDRIHCARGDRRGTLSGASLASAPGDFGDGVTAFGLADVDRDGRADACAVVHEEIRCALGRPDGTFDPSTRWLRAGVTATLPTPSRWVFADVDADQRADACRVEPNKVTCVVASAHGHGFVRPRVWSTIDPQATLRLMTAAFGDIDGDGDADVCALSDGGVECAKSTGSGFTAFLLRVPRFPEDMTWNDRVVLADVDADHRADSCRWGAFGVVCSPAP